MKPIKRHYAQSLKVEVLMVIIIIFLMALNFLTVTLCILVV